MWVDPWGLNKIINGLIYDDCGNLIGEIGLEPAIPIPDVTIGMDAPFGGVETTLPFGSGGDITTVEKGPSYNTPAGPGVNIKITPSVNPGGDTISGSVTVTTPIGVGGASVNTNGDVNVNVNGPKLNIPLGYGVNAYIGTKW